MELADCIPFLNCWVPWCLGLVIAMAALYNGLPRILQPDAPSALGLFLGSGFVLITLLFLQRFLTCWFFVRQFRPFDGLLTVFTMKFF